MRRIALLLLAGCTVSTSRFEELEPCTTDDHCTLGYSCLSGRCARCVDGHACRDGGTCGSGADCDDGDLCTGAETCVDGVCHAGDALDCRAMDDPRICVVGGCVGGVCVPQVAIDDAACDDGVFCLSGDVCQAGTCIGGTTPSCNDGDQCTVDTCDEEANVCRSSPGTEGAAGDPTCSDGQDNDCDGQIDLDDPACLTTCPEGESCDDLDFCNGDDRCNAAGVCVNVGPAPCAPDQLSCTLTCDETIDACNVIVSSACAIDGTCYSAGALNPANPCQECVPVVSGWSWTDDDTNFCVNGLFCDSLDQCMSGVCMGTVQPACVDDGLACTTLCDESIDECNVVDLGWCRIDGVCYADGEPDPANPCQECVSSVDQEGWSFDNANPCADAFDCTDDACSDGACVSSITGPCGPGEVCRPQCFGGPTGCGVPPGAVAVQCPSPTPVSGSSACSVTLTGGTELGQASCLSCVAEVGSVVLGHADFEECPATLDGFGAQSGSPVCTTAGSNHFLQASGASWVIERSFDTTGLEDLELCFSYAESAMDTGDTLTVSVCADGTCAVSLALLADTAGPSSGDTAWHRYCFDVDAHDATALNNPTLLVRFAASSSAAGQLVQIDDIDLRGRRSACAPASVPGDDDSFMCTGSACGVMGWTSSAGCNIVDPCGALGLAAGTMETLDVCRGVDLAGQVGDRFVMVDVGEANGDDAASAETFSVEVCDGPPGAGCTCAAGWQQVFSHTGDLDGLAPLSMRHFVADLSGLAFADATLGVRFVASATGPGDSVELDRIRVGTRDYTCPSAGLSVGSIIELGGGGYSVDLTSSEATTAQLQCSWDTVFPPIISRDSTEFLP